MTSSREIAQTVFQSLQAGEKPADVATALEAFLGESNLKQLLPTVLAHLERLVEESQQSDAVRITVSHEVSKKTEGAIKKMVGAEEGASSEVTVDPAIISGFIARYQGKIFDASGKRQLINLKHSLLA